MQQTINVLENINTPDDLKELSLSDMKELAKEIRECIIKKVDTIGGHLGPNLGIVEATIAMHYVFNSPVDKIVFDVSHQCYPHKILTGRKEGFINPDLYLKYTGYTAPEESEHDMFKVGHTSTSVSLATGLAKARDIKGEKGNVIALIGDGSLSGGEAFEGLDNAATLNSNIIIVVNDNDMSIAVNQGGLYANLKYLRDTNGEGECNFFKSLGFDYYYVNDGNDIQKLIETFEKVKDINHPVVVHITTLKGKGCELAEKNKEMFHWIMPNTIKNFGKPAPKIEDYATTTVDFILRKKEEGMPIVAISAATPAVTGFTHEFRDKMGKNYVDVGIAEEHAMAFSSGLAKNGARPVLGIMSSFVQRAYDQISQDLALNNSPATVLVFWGAISGADATHLTCFDIPLISNIPNVVYLAPTNKEEYLKMLEWSTSQNEHTVFIRVPAGELISSNVADNTDYSILNKYQVVEKGSKIAILGLGNFFYLAKDVKEKLKQELNINATLINPKFISGIDKELLNSLKSDHKIVITLEDGILNGGFGEKIASYYGNSDMKVLNYGAEKDFPDRIPLDVLYQRYRLTPELILEDVKACL